MTTQTIALDQELENELLHKFVDALMSVEDDLADASEPEWSEIVLDSCRQQKWGQA